MIAAKRFWTSVSVEAQPEGFAVLLDDRPVKTPGKSDLRLPTRALAEAIAEEWDAIEGEIDPSRLHVTKLANTAIDRIPAKRGDLIDALAAYGETDLLCYRAEEPAKLAARQAERWDPWLAWARDTHDAPLDLVAGVMHQPQPPESLERLRAAIDACDAFRLVALSELVALSGSLVLGLATLNDALEPVEAWVLSRLDEDWQAEQWGVDSEAASAAERKWLEFEHAAQFARMA